MSKRFKSARSCDSSGGVASQAVLIEVVRALEEQLRMLPVQLPAEGGQ
jgi:hypothetical protein